MESLGRLASKVEDLEVVLPALAAAMDRAAEWLSSRDQVRDLEAAAKEVLKRVREMVSGELLAQQLYFERAANREVLGLLTNVVTLIFGAGFQPRPPQADEHPPFRRAEVAVGLGGVPEDLLAVNVSHLAREQGASEAEVEQALSAQGYVLFASQEFSRFAAWLGREILEGRIRLPYHPSAPGNVGGESRAV